MSLKDKFAGLKFSKQELTIRETTPISGDWSRLLAHIKPINTEMHIFFNWLIGQGVQLKPDNDLGISIVLDGERFSALPAINIDINPEKRIEWPDGAELM